MLPLLSFIVSRAFVILKDQILRRAEGRGDLEVSGSNKVRLVSCRSALTGKERGRLEDCWMGDGEVLALFYYLQLIVISCN